MSYATNYFDGLSSSSQAFIVGNLKDKQLTNICLWSCINLIPERRPASIHLFSNLKDRIKNRNYHAITRHSCLCDDPFSASQFRCKYAIEILLSKYHNGTLTDLAQALNIVQTAINDGNFKTLAAALGAADLVTTLTGAGPFTVFAPTDAAFEKLAPGTVTDLLKPENKEKLAQILKYHVLGKSLTGTQINAMAPSFKETTLEGTTIQVSRHGTHLQINDASVTQADVLASNGVIHVIDAVLMPSAASSITHFYLNQAVLLLFVCTIALSSLRFL